MSSLTSIPLEARLLGVPVQLDLRRPLVARAAEILERAEHRVQSVQVGHWSSDEVLSDLLRAALGGSDLLIALRIAIEAWALQASSSALVSWDWIPRQELIVQLSIAASRLRASARLLPSPAEEPQPRLVRP